MRSQLIVRKGSFDAGHRVMNERMKCFNLHGHTYLYEVGFYFNTTKDIGYAIDFKEIKRVACAFIDEFFDHGTILNPQDNDVIDLCLSSGWKTWILGDYENYINPTVENITAELMVCIHYIFDKLDAEGLFLKRLTIHETPNCYVEYQVEDLKDITHHRRVVRFFDWPKEKINLLDGFVRKVNKLIEYDDRKI